MRDQPSQEPMISPAPQEQKRPFAASCLGLIVQGIAYPVVWYWARAYTSYALDLWAIRHPPPGVQVDDDGYLGNLTAFLAVWFFLGGQIALEAAFTLRFWRTTSLRRVSNLSGLVLAELTVVGFHQGILSLGPIDMAVGCLAAAFVTGELRSWLGTWIEHRRTR